VEIILSFESTLTIEIIPYLPIYKESFKQLNMAWLEKFFVVEDFDLEVLSNPEKYILDKGGFIFFAKHDKKIVGTCALMKDSENTWELTKMAVDDAYQGKKIGHKLAEAVIEKFKSFGHGALFLESNSKLVNALHIYKKLGFVLQDKLKEQSHYDRADVYMIYQP
jgi:GNAT superfamily N-acetyltransferase